MDSAALLDVKAVNGDATAAYALGRALCGINVGQLPASVKLSGISWGQIQMVVQREVEWRGHWLAGN